MMSEELPVKVRMKVMPDQLELHPCRTQNRNNFYSPFDRIKNALTAERISICSLFG